MGVVIFYMHECVVDCVFENFLLLFLAQLVVPNGLQFTCGHGGLHVLPFLSKQPLITNDPSRKMIFLSFFLLFLSSFARNY